jgi:hypothetical protein
VHDAPARRVADDTLELDRFLASGRLPSSVRSSSPPSAASKPNTGWPRLAAQLPSGASLPKRPRAVAKPPQNRTLHRNARHPPPSTQTRTTTRISRRRARSRAQAGPRARAQPAEYPAAAAAAERLALRPARAPPQARPRGRAGARVASDAPARSSAQRVQVPVDATPLRKTPTSVPRMVSFDVREPEHSRSSISVDVRLGGGAGTPAHPCATTGTAAACTCPT